MFRVVTLILLSFAGASVAGCNLLLAPVSAASHSITGSIQGGGALAVYAQAHGRATRSDNQANPRRRPRTISPQQNYTFNNAIPFFPWGRGGDVTSDFGWRNLWGKADFHCGVDVQASPGTAILAVTSGRVTLARSAGRNGGVVIYSGGRQYTYWHMEPAKNLREGKSVRKGQRIGALADWGGNSHLHYGLYLTGADDSPNARKITNCVDPMRLAQQGLF